MLLFNATVETPIVGKFLGMSFSELWPSWFKANVWSLLAGIPALVLNEAVTGWFLPTEMGRRVRFYPLFIVLFILIFYAATCAAEYLSARRIAREAEAQVGVAAMLKAVLLANLVSYVVLGPVYFIIARPRIEISEFRPDARWSKAPALTVLAVGSDGHLEAATVNGQTRRTVVPHEVRDYVVSADLAQVLYRGEGDRFCLFNRGTNTPLPELGFWCLAPEMDFSPNARYAAFIKWDTHQLRVFDSQVGRFKDVPTFGEGTDCSLAWSSKEDRLYVRTGNETWEILLEPVAAYRRLTSPPQDFANHYGRIGTTRSRDGVRYTHHRDGPLRLMVWPGWGNHLSVFNQQKSLLKLRDPAGQFGIEQAVFLEGSGEILVGIGDVVYILDTASKRMGPVMHGQQFVALAKPFAKQVGFEHE